jgi:hypothetical protein
MRIKVGCELVYECPQPTPMLLTLNIHYSRASDIEAPDPLVISPAVPVTAYIAMASAIGSAESWHRPD